MGKLVWLNCERVRRFLRRGISARVLVMLEQGPTWFNIGNDLQPPMQLVVEDEYWAANLSLNGKRTPVCCPWASVIKVEPLFPPNGGPGNRKAA